MVVAGTKANKTIGHRWLGADLPCRGHSLLVDVLRAARRTPNYQDAIRYAGLAASGKSMRKKIPVSQRHHARSGVVYRN
jgi:hypothetical protein